MCNTILWWESFAVSKPFSNRNVTLDYSGSREISLKVHQGDKEKQAPNSLIIHKAIKMNIIIHTSIEYNQVPSFQWSTHLPIKLVVGLLLSFQLELVQTEAKRPQGAKPFRPSRASNWVVNPSYTEHRKHCTEFLDLKGRISTVVFEMNHNSNKSLSSWRKTFFEFLHEWGEEQQTLSGQIL